MKFSDSKYRQVELTTPIGTFMWPRLNEPVPNKFSGDIQYECSLSVPKDKAKQLVAQLTELFEENLKLSAKDMKKPVKAAAKPWSDETDKDGNLTGNIIFRARRRAKGVSKTTGKPWEYKVKLFDASGKPLVDKSVGGGSTGRLVLQVRGYCIRGEAGISLALQAAQVINCVAGKNSAKDFGFTPEVTDIPAEYDVGVVVEQ